MSPCSARREGLLERADAGGGLSLRPPPRRGIRRGSARSTARPAPQPLIRRDDRMTVPTRASPLRVDRAPLWLQFAGAVRSHGDDPMRRCALPVCLRFACIGAVFALKRDPIRRDPCRSGFLSPFRRSRREVNLQGRLADGCVGLGASGRGDDGSCQVQIVRGGDAGKVRSADVAQGHGELPAGPSELSARQRRMRLCAAGSPRAWRGGPKAVLCGEMRCSRRQSIDWIRSMRLRLHSRETSADDAGCAAFLCPEIPMPKQQRRVPRSDRFRGLPRDAERLTPGSQQSREGIGLVRSAGGFVPRHRPTFSARPRAGPEACSPDSRTRPDPRAI